MDISIHMDPDNDPDMVTFTTWDDFVHMNEVDVVIDVLDQFADDGVAMIGDGASSLIRIERMVP